MTTWCKNKCRHPPKECAYNRTQLHTFGILEEGEEKDCIHYQWGKKKQYISDYLEGDIPREVAEDELDATNHPFVTSLAEGEKIVALWTTCEFCSGMIFESAVVQVMDQNRDVVAYGWTRDEMTVLDDIPYMDEMFWLDLRSMSPKEKEEKLAQIKKGWAQRGWRGLGVIPCFDCGRQTCTTSHHKLEECAQMTAVFKEELMAMAMHPSRLPNF